MAPVLLYTLPQLLRRGRRCSASLPARNLRGPDADALLACVWKTQVSPSVYPTRGIKLRHAPSELGGTRAPHQGERRLTLTASQAPGYRNLALCPLWEADPLAHARSYILGERRAHACARPRLPLLVQPSGVNDLPLQAHSQRGEALLDGRVTWGLRPPIIAHVQTTTSSRAGGTVASERPVPSGRCLRNTLSPPAPVVCTVIAQPPSGYYFRYNSMTGTATSGFSTGSCRVTT